MTIAWNSDADAKFIVALVTANSNPIEWHAVAKLMGEGCTVSALKHRLSRLRGRVSLAGAASGSGASNSPAATPKTPKKGKRTTPTKAIPSKGGAKKVDTAMEVFKSPKVETCMNDIYNKMEEYKEIGSDEEIEVVGVDQEC